MKNIAEKICNENGYTLHKIIGQGGSGCVYCATKDNKEYAIKIVTRAEVLPRLRREIECTKRLSGHGVIDIIKSDCVDGQYGYYIMPLKVQINDYLKSHSTDYSAKMDIIRKLSNILNNMASAKIYHRDIKPNNIVVDPDGDKIYLIDLGLVSDGELSTLTKTDSRIGSLTFIAPERIRPDDNKMLDNEKADVYSFGMTAWAILTGESKGFGGQYTKHDTRNSLSAHDIGFRGISVIEDVLEVCTASNPDQRPVFKEIVAKLNRFDSHSSYSLSDFYADCQFVYEKTRPNYIVWNGIDDIATVLQKVIKEQYNLEILFPDGGWFNVQQVRKSADYSEFIEIYTGDIVPPMLMSPNYLVLANFDDIPFYLLEARAFTPFVKKFLYDAEDDLDWEQSVCELSPYEFTYAQCYQYNDYNGEDLGKGAKQYNLVLSGRFLINLLNNKNEILEHVWEKEPDRLAVNFPFYKMAAIEERDKFRFNEITKFKSRQFLLSCEEEDAILNLIEFIKSQSDNDRITGADISSYLELHTSIADFLYTVFDIEHVEFDNGKTSSQPFYRQLPEVLKAYSKTSAPDEYYINRHPEFRSSQLIWLLYHFLYRYAVQQEKYLKLPIYC